MIEEQLREAIASAPSGIALDNLARLLWRGLAEGHVTDAAAQALGEAVEARRALFRSRTAFPTSKGSSARPRRPMSPDRAASIARRRRQAASGAMPAALASAFTTGEVAVLTVIARQIQRVGQCELPIDAIAALAGVGRTTAQRALREAARLGFITITERRRRGRPSLTNVVAIVALAWRAWLRLGGGGFGKRSTTDTRDSFCTGERAHKPVHHAQSSPPGSRNGGRSVSQIQCREA